MSDARHETVTIESAGAALTGDLNLPPDPVGVVAFAHGSGSSRLSPRNRQVAEALNEQGLATLLFDLLGEEESRIDERTAEYRFDIPLLGRRMTGAVDWLGRYETTAWLPTGLFGASTGAAAALIAAAERPGRVGAVVSRGGRPDLAGEALPDVRAPTLLVVGGRDPTVIDLNNQAAERLQCESHVEIIPGATHLFEEPGTLEAVCRAASRWLVKYLGNDDVLQPR